MIAVDTNVLVRFLVEDDKEQNQRAARLFREAVERNETIFFPEIVLVETVWVLSRCYRLPRKTIAQVLRAVLSAKNAERVHEDRVERALCSYEQGPGGFADYLILEDARARGCRAVFTFDKTLLRRPGFSAP
jgi:predicted nucleic-acid-binding protein